MTQEDITLMGNVFLKERDIYAKRVFQGKARKRYNISTTRSIRLVAERIGSIPLGDLPLHINDPKLTKTMKNMIRWRLENGL